MKKIAWILTLLTVFFSLTSCGYNCETCHDKSKIVCPDCNGKKDVMCILCDGDGTRPCALCAGTGSRTCYYCGGSGSKLEYDVLQSNYVSKSCSMCTFGYVSCATTAPCTCSDGKTGCVTCTSQGEVDCPDC